MGELWQKLLTSCKDSVGRLSNTYLKLCDFDHTNMKRLSDTGDHDSTPERRTKRSEAVSGPRHKIRLDKLLADRGLLESRSRAAVAVMAGEVRVDGERVTKPGQLVARGAGIELTSRPEFVSRAGVKLANAIDHFRIEVAGRDCLDVGASTGGFTDCLLQRGARRVVALDVAYGELHWKLRNDPRVTVIERQNARYLRRSMLPFKPNLITIDVSFISLAKVLPAVLGTRTEQFVCLALVKPQFEVGREQLANGGVVRDAAARRQALLDVGKHVQSEGLAVRGFCFSGLEGPAGNRESFILIRDNGAGVEDLERAVLEAEPHE